MKNGINTYASLIQVVEDEVENPQFNTATENKLVCKYLKKAEIVDSNSSFHGERGKRNLVATLADIFMGGRFVLCSSM